MHGFHGTDLADPSSAMIFDELISLVLESGLKLDPVRVAKVDDLLAEHLLESGSDAAMMAARILSRLTIDLPRSTAIIASQGGAARDLLAANGVPLPAAVVHEIVKTAPNEVLEGVARRGELDAEATDLIARRGTHEVHVALLENPRADIGEKAMTHLVERSRVDPKLRSRLVQRPHLPAEVVRDLMKHASERQRCELAAVQTALTEDEFAKLNSESLLEFAKRMRRGPKTGAKEIERKLAAGVLSFDEAVVVLAAQNQIGRVAELFAERLGLRPEVSVRCLVGSTEVDDILAMSRVLNLDVATFAVLASTCRSRFGGGRTGKTELFQLYSEMTIDEAREIVQKLRTATEAA